MSDRVVVDGVCELEIPIEGECGTFYKVNPTSEALTVSPTSEDVTYQPDADYFSEVTVEGIKGERTITRNGDYDVLTDKQVTVAVDPPVLDPLTATANGRYIPAHDGFSEVTVDVPPDTVPLNVAANGTYTRQGGYNPVTVSLPKAMTAEQIATGEDVWGDLVIEAEYIRSYAFRVSMEYDPNTGESYYKQDRITSLYAPNLKAVGEYAFFNQGGLKRITLPKCTAIGQNAFGGYSMYFPSQKTYLYAPKLKRINRGLYSNVGPATWIIPPNVKSIDTSVFTLVGYRMDKEPIVIIILADKNVTIDANAFPRWTGLTDIYVPWSEGEVANAPWGATTATIHYDTPLDDFAASWDGNLLQQEVIHPV